jgi:hypothetical protein
MSKPKKSGLGSTPQHSAGKPKKTRQGASQRTKHSASSANKATKPYRGQGR